MKFPTWIPKYLLARIEENEELLNASKQMSPSKKKKVKRNLAILKRLGTDFRMEKVWDEIKLDELEALWITKIDLFMMAVHRALDEFDFGVTLSLEQYKDEMSEISKLSKTLSRKLHKFSIGSEENNPFHYRSIFTEEDRSLFKTEAQRKIYEGTELSENRAHFYPDDYFPHDFPTINQLLERVSKAAQKEKDELSFRLDLPRRTGAPTARRTYLIKKIATYLNRQDVTHPTTNAATICAVILEDDSITPDLVRKLCPPMSVKNNSPFESVTPEEIKSMIHEMEKMQKLVNDIVTSDK